MVFTDIILPILLFVIGLILIVKGGDVFVDAATYIAEANGIPKILVGVTIVSFATTLPEVLVSIIASIGGNNDMAIGNAIGSVNANIGLIFALLMVFCPGIAKRSGYMLKAFLMLGACLTLAVFGLIGVLTWPASVILLAIFGFFMFFNIKDAKKAILLGEGDGEEKPEKTKKLMIKNIILFIVGTLAVGGGALLLVEYGPKLAIMIGVPDAIVSAIFVAIGTSLPELVTAITAIAKKQGALSMGNIIGANIIDLAIILPICALIGGGTLAFNLQNMYLDLPVCLLIGAIALAPSLITQKISRAQGISLLTVYTAYIILMCVYFI